MLTVGTIKVRMRDLGPIFSAAKWASTSARRKIDKCGSDPCQLSRHILRAYGTGSQALMSCLQGWQVPCVPSAIHKVALSDAWRDTMAVYGFSPSVWKEPVFKICEIYHVGTWRWIESSPRERIPETNKHLVTRPTTSDWPSSSGESGRDGRNRDR